MTSLPDLSIILIHIFNHTVSSRENVCQFVKLTQYRCLSHRKFIPLYRLVTFENLLVVIRTSYCHLRRVGREGRVTAQDYHPNSQWFPRRNSLSFTVTVTFLWSNFLIKSRGFFFFYLVWTFRQKKKYYFGMLYCLIPNFIFP